MWTGGYLGTYDVAEQHALLLHWDGSSVQRGRDPISQSSADASSVTGVAASDSGNVWVVGRETSGGVTTPVAERWDGSAWVEHDPVLRAGSGATVRAVSTNPVYTDSSALTLPSSCTIGSSVSPLDARVTATDASVMACS